MKPIQESRTHCNERVFTNVGTSLCHILQGVYVIQFDLRGGLLVDSQVTGSAEECICKCCRRVFLCCEE